MGPSPVWNQDKGRNPWWRPLLYRLTIYVLAYPFVLLDPCLNDLAVGPPPFESWNKGKDPWLRSQLFRWRIYILEDPFGPIYLIFDQVRSGSSSLSSPTQRSGTHNQEPGLCIKQYRLSILDCRVAHLNKGLVLGKISEWELSLPLKWCKHWIWNRFDHRGWETSNVQSWLRWDWYPQARIDQYHWNGRMIWKTWRIHISSHQKKLHMIKMDRLPALEFFDWVVGSRWLIPWIGQIVWFHNKDWFWQPPVVKKVKEMFDLKVQLVLFWEMWSKGRWVTLFWIDPHRCQNQSQSIWSLVSFFEPFSSFLQVNQLQGLFDLTLHQKLKALHGILILLIVSLVWLPF